MTRNLALVITPADCVPAPVSNPKPVKVPEGVEAQARTLHQRLSRVVATLSGGHSTDLALSRARAEAFEIGAEIMRLGRRL